MFLSNIILPLILHSVLCFYCFFCVLCSSEKHFLSYKFTVLCKANTRPVFKAVSVCDDRQIAQYSNEERVWKRSRLTEDDWIKAPEESSLESRDWFLHQLHSLSNCSDSQCSGELHALLINYHTCYEIACIFGHTLFYGQILAVNKPLTTTLPKYTPNLLLINSQ